LCSPTGNCPRWIFEKISTGWKEELELFEAQNVMLEPSTARFPYIVAQQHSSALDSALYVYRFNGTRFGLTKCAAKTYRDPIDIDHILEKPIVTEFPCR
jgi:hypothetical protein